MTPKPVSCEKEMLDMVLRHKPKKNAENKQSDQWRIPQNIRRVVAQCFNTGQERFSSPLTVATAETMYYQSNHERDQAFGAHTQIYNHKWTLEAAPPVGCAYY